MGRGLEKKGSSARGVGVVGAEEQRMSRGGGKVAHDGGRGLRSLSTVCLSPLA